MPPPPSPADPPTTWMQHMKVHCFRCFDEQALILWPNLSRAASLLAVLNTSMFFLSGAVQHRGYYWPIYSLGLIAVIEVILLLPLGLNRKLWFYAAVLLLWCVAAWFFVGSLLHWLAAGPAA